MKTATVTIERMTWGYKIKAYCDGVLVDSRSTTRDVVKVRNQMLDELCERFDMVTAEAIR